MFVRITAAAVVIALLAHSLLGCCWHRGHGHGSGEALGVLHGCHPAASPSDHQGTETAHDPDDPGQPGHRHSPGDEPDCSFVGVPAPGVVDDGGMAAPTTFPLVRVEGSRAESPAASTIAATAPPLSTARLRAALQVWLV